MGGSAFSSGGRNLSTPRMPAEVYIHVKQQCHQLLFQHFFCVATPIEGPGKKDFGDIDILVCHHKLGKVLDDEEWVKELAAILDAVDYIFTKGNGASANFALPWPEQIRPENHTGNLYIQVDIRVCSTLEHLHWILFKHAHGDLWSILGSIIRPYGVTLDERAFWLRVEEIEAINKNRAKVLLTTEPAKVLSFLGVPIGDFWDRPFETVDDMFQYATNSNMMYVRTEDTKTDATVNMDPATMSSNDRKRLRMRPAYQEFFDNFIPKCRMRGDFAQRKTSREEVTAQAMSYFAVTEEFMQRRREYLIERHRDMIYRKLIKDAIPAVDDTSDMRAVNYRSHLIKALKLTILEGSQDFGYTFDQSNIDENGLLDIVKVQEFVHEHKDAIGKAAVDIQHAKYLESECRRLCISDEKN